MFLYVWAAVFVASFLAGFVYRALWLRLKPDGTTPKGFGALLPVFLLGFGRLLDDSAAALGVYAVAAAGALPYWWDDVGDVSFRIRLVLQFAAGAAIGALLLQDSFATPVLIACALAAGALNVVLVNAINFFDGADLNSSTMAVLTAALVMAFAPAPLQIAAAIVLPFALGFMAWNQAPNTLWFGDSGCFVLACLATAIGVHGVTQGAAINLLPLAPVGWAGFDALWVFLIRLRNKEDLLSRNYHHLYQKMQQRFGGWYYLLPQFANAAIVIAVAYALQAAGLTWPLAASLSAVLATPLVYLSCRAAFVR